MKTITKIPAAKLTEKHQIRIYDIGLVPWLVCDVELIREQERASFLSLETAWGSY